MVQYRKRRVKDISSSFIQDMKSKTFEEFMQEMHYKVFPMVLDDDLPDHFNDWLGSLDGEDYMRCAEQYGREQYLSGQAHVIYAKHMENERQN